MSHRSKNHSPSNYSEVGILLHIGPQHSVCLSQIGHSPGLNLDDDKLNQTEMFGYRGSDLENTRGPKVCVACFDIEDTSDSKFRSVVN